MMKLLRAFWKSLAGNVRRDGQGEGKGRKKRGQENEDGIRLREQAESTSHSAIGQDTTSADSPRQFGAEEIRSPPIRVREEEPKREAVIQVGIDFGTSTTKIAYRQVRSRGNVRPLVFDHDLEGIPQFGLPTLAMVDRRGKLLVGIEAGTHIIDRSWDEALRAFKVLVASLDSGFETSELRDAFDRYSRQHPLNGRVLTPETVSFVYLAYAMREARRRICELPEYVNSRLEFLYNVCLPMQHLESNPVVSAFRQILAKAEAAERHWPYESGTEWLTGNFGFYETTTLGASERVFLIPESVAEAASYVSSLRSNPGLHALIDIGAGTTDVSFFNLVDEPTGKHCYWYSSGNLPLGGLAIERLVGMNGEGGLTAGQISEKINRLRRGTQPDSTLVGGVMEIMSRIHKKARPVWSAAYKHLRKEDPWHRVEVFLSGGGSEVAGAEETFARPWWRHLSQQYVRYSVAALPEPDDYDSLDGRGPFSRMAVAYGLTFPEPELGSYTLPGLSPDHTPPPPPIRLPDLTAPWV